MPVPPWGPAGPAAPGAEAVLTGQAQSRRSRGPSAADCAGAVPPPGRCGSTTQAQSHPPALAGRPRRRSSSAPGPDPGSGQPGGCGFGVVGGLGCCGVAGSSAVGGGPDAYVPGRRGLRRDGRPVLPAGARRCRQVRGARPPERPAAEPREVRGRGAHLCGSPELGLPRNSAARPSRRGAPKGSARRAGCT